jgi:RNA polymerase sigma factor (sigma-70 family)
MSFEDLVAWGNQGLIAAASSFDPNRRRPEFEDPISFAHYAEPRIKGAMLDGCRKESPFGDCRTRKRLPRLERVPIGTEDELGPLVGDQHLRPDDMAARADYRRLVVQLSEAVEKLPPHLRAFTRAHYYQEVPLRDVGRELGVSKFVVQRLRNAAIREISSLLVTPHRRIPDGGAVL